MSVDSYTRSVLLSSLAAMICVGCIDPEAPRFPDALIDRGDLDAAAAPDAMRIGERADAGTTADAAEVADAEPLRDADTISRDGTADDADATVPETPDAEPVDAAPPEGLFAGGEGTVESPYLISTVEHLHNIRCWPEARFVLIDNITIPEGQPFVPIGAGLAASDGCPDTPFQGALDGNEFSICGLHIDGRALDAPVGLFSRVDGAIIHRLSLIGVTIVASVQPAGALIGEINSAEQHETLIQSIRVSGSVQGDDVTGGVVGQGSDVTLSRITSTATVRGEGPVGGIVGALRNSTITEVQVFSDRIELLVPGPDNGQPTGGIVGELSGQGGLRVFAVQVAWLQGQRFTGGAVGRLSTGDALNDGYTAGTLLTAGASPEHAGGLVGLYAGGPGINRAFSVMDTDGASPRASSGRVLGGYNGDVSMVDVYYQEGIGEARCVGTDYNTPQLCTLIGNVDGYFRDRFFPPMSLWAQNRWTFSDDALPTLTLAPSPPDQACP